MFGRSWGDLEAGSTASAPRLLDLLAHRSKAQAGSLGELLTRPAGVIRGHAESSGRRNRGEPLGAALGCRFNAPGAIQRRVEI